MRATSSTKPSPSASPLLDKFLHNHRELDAHSKGQAIEITGKTLSVAAVTAAARYNAPVTLSSASTSALKAEVKASRSVIENKVAHSTSVYGVSTGFGGSADTRTDQPLLLGQALLQHQHVGITPTNKNRPTDLAARPDVLPLMDPAGSTIMPESWVRGAMVIRMNSLIRGHSAVRWELIEKINELLEANITPVVPLRGSISASGDLSPLSYIAGTLIGNPSISVYVSTPGSPTRSIVPSNVALAQHNIQPLTLLAKEPLGILNGTAFSASVASLALSSALHLTLLTQVLTALGTEAMLGTRASFHPFIHATARPHKGQIEVASTIWDLLEGSKLATVDEDELEEDVPIEQDKYSLRQDRYPLRTSPQWLGPQVEDLIKALAVIEVECNSTTDNPLVEIDGGKVHHGGNFQAMSVTNTMESIRLSLHHLGKLLFAQSTELVNPAMNHGLPPSVAATDPSLNYHTKGIDIATAAYVSELGWLANPVSTHVQSAEMHNQAVNSLALISARATINSLDVLSMLSASYLYVLCQAVDLRALRSEFNSGLSKIVSQELASHFKITQPTIVNKIKNDMFEALDKSSTMDAKDQMDHIVGSSSTTIVDYLGSSGPSSDFSFASIKKFRDSTSSQLLSLLQNLRTTYLSGDRGAAPAALYLGKTRAVYEYVRVGLGIKMHGSENLSQFANGLGRSDVEGADVSIGGQISLIYESIRDGKMQEVVASLF